MFSLWLFLRGIVLVHQEYYHWDQDWRWIQQSHQLDWNDVFTWCLFSDLKIFVFDNEVGGYSGPVSLRWLFEGLPQLTALDLFVWVLNEMFFENCFCEWFLFGMELETQGVFQLGKDWRSIQHSQNWIWKWGVDNVWLKISWWYD